MASRTRNLSGGCGAGSGEEVLPRAAPGGPGEGADEEEMDAGNMEMAGSGCHTEVGAEAEGWPFDTGRGGQQTRGENDSRGMAPRGAGPVRRRGAARVGLRLRGQGRGLESGPRGPCPPMV